MDLVSTKTTLAWNHSENIFAMHISRDVSTISIANALSKAPLSKDSIEEWFS